MIIFYNKATGDIKGTINGRVHDEGHLNMWIGDKDETQRIVIEWIPVGTVQLQDGKEANVYEPNIDQKEQRDIFMGLERGELKTKDFKVDLTSKNLVPIEV